MGTKLLNFVPKLNPMPMGIYNQRYSCQEQKNLKIVHPWACFGHTLHLFCALSVPKVFGYSLLSTVWAQNVVFMGAHWVIGLVKLIWAQFGHKIKPCSKVTFNLVTWLYILFI